MPENSPSTSSPYVYVWTFKVKSGCESQFEKIYGPKGEWVSLFEKAPGYLRTELLRDKAMPGRYLTIDYWENELSHQQFRQQFDSDFRHLDQLCDRLTDSEVSLGHFAVVGPGQKTLSGVQPAPSERALSLAEERVLCAAQYG